jgi:virginiamycin B lyase
MLIGIGGGRGLILGILLVCAITLGSGACLTAAADAFVYWTNFSDGTIGRANLDGTEPDQSFISGASEPTGIAVDGGHIYWADRATNTIARADIDGMEADQSFITGANSPDGVAVDAGHIYWTNRGSGAIGRANLDGTGVKQGFITGLTTPVAIAVAGSDIYWTTGFEVEEAIGRANLDGGDVEKHFISGSNAPSGIAADRQHIYWSNRGLFDIGRANPDRGEVSQDFVGEAAHPLGLALDRRFIYWADEGGAIGRAGLDGGAPEQNLVEVAGTVAGVAVDAGPAGTASASAASLEFGPQRLDSLSTPESLEVTNTGHGDLGIDSVEVVGADRDDFLLSSDSCSNATLLIGDSCTVDVRFSPSASSARSATLSVGSDGPSSPLLVPLSGSGELPPQGTAGPGGPQGPQGSPGPQGERGPRGKTEILTCTPATGRGKALRASRMRCTTRPAVNPSRTGLSDMSLTAVLSRGNVVYADATGSIVSGGMKIEFLLAPRRDIGKGEYALAFTLGGRRHQVRVNLD